MKKEPAGLKSISTNSSPSPAITTAKTTKKDDYNDFNFSNQNNYKKFTDFLKESKTKQQQQQQKIECNCWVCKILDSSVTKTGDEILTTTAGQYYEPYNIVSDTGDSIFYDPLISSIFCLVA